MSSTERGVKYEPLAKDKRSEFEQIAQGLKDLHEQHTPPHSANELLGVVATGAEGKDVYIKLNQSYQL